MSDIEIARPIGSERAHFSISQQIEEVRHQIEHMEKSFPFLISRNRLRQSVATYKLDRMRAVLRTLRWLRDNEAAIKARAPQ